MKRTETKSLAFTHMDMIADAVAGERRTEMLEFPGDDTIAFAGRLVTADDRSVPITVRAISMYFKLVDEDDTAHVYRWPDGIVAVIRGDIPDPSDWKAYRKVVASAYRSAYDRLLADAFGPLDE